MKLFYKLFFLLNLLFFPFNFLKANDNEGLGELMNTHASNVREGSGISEVSLGVTIAYGIRLLLSLLATIFLVLIIISGIKWMTASGNQETISKAGKSIKEAIIGLIIVMAAYAITWFIFSQLQIAGGFGLGGGGGASGGP
jgi:hypothetical protein